VHRVSLATAYVAIRPDTKGFGASLLRTVNADATKAGKDAGKKMGGAFSGGVRGLAASAGGALGVGLGVAAVGGFLKQSVGLEASFGKTMNVLQATTKAPKKDMADLSALAMKMGADTVFSANDASKAMLELARGGMDAAAIKAGALKGTMTLAAAGELEMGDAASYIVKGLGQFNLGAGKSSAVAAALAGAANASSASVGDMGFALSQAGLAANSAGFSIQETTGILAAFSNNGLEGSDAGTSLKTMLSSLQPSTANAAGAFHELGLMTEDGTNKLIKANGEYVSAARMAELLKKGTEGLTRAEANRNIRAAFGSDAQRAATIMAKEGAAGIREMTKATSDQSAAQDMANANMKGTAGALERASGAYETLQLRIGQALAPVVRGLALTFADVLVPALIGTVNAILSVSGIIADNSTAFKGLAIVIGTVVAVTRLHATVMAVEAAGGMLQYLKATRLVTAATKIWAAVTRAYTAVQWALNVALNANPLGLFVAAIALVAAGLVIAYKRSDKFREIVDGAFNAVKNVASTVLGWFTRSFVPFFTDTIPGAFAATKGWVKRNWPAILAIITGPIGLATLFIVNHWDTITDAFRDAKNWAVGAFKRAWSAVQGVVLTPIRAARDTIRDVFGGNGPVRTAFTNVKNWATGTFKRAWDNVQGVIMTPLRAARDAIGRLFGRGGPIRNAFSNAVDGIGRIWAGLRNAAMAPVRFVVNTVYNKGIQEILSRIPGVPHPKDIQGFQGGGWTGPGGRDRPAGIVHADEHVWTKEEANRFPGGHRGLERLRTRARMGLIREGEFADVPGYATGGRVRMDGKWLSVIAARQIRLMERMAKVNFRVMQGGYGGSHIGASGTSHNYSGVADFSPASIQYERLARRVGFAAWARNIPGRSSVGSGAHIHAVSLLDPGDRRSPQVYGSWANHGNGLRGANNDPAPHVPWLPNLRALLGNIPLANLGGGGGGGGGYAGPSVGDVVSALNPATWVRRLRGIGGWGGMLGGMVRNVAGAAKRVLVDKVKAAIRTVGRALTGGAGPVSGPVSQTVRRVANTYGWGQGDEWNALANIISHESSWDPNAKNRSSSARGLFQKMTSLHGPIERTVEGQTLWGLNYIKDRYGDPIGAWQHWQRNRSYDTGAIANGAGWIYKGPGKERVLNERQTNTYDQLLPILERIERGGGTGTGPVRIVLDAGGGVTLTGHIDNRIQGRAAQSATVRRQHR
jgi:TP901 family phage tail tape measure protein